MNYYNENNVRAAAWLDNLQREGLIPHGHVDSRDVRDVSAADLAGYTQCHFFAGIGGWPVALSIAGWPTNRPVWTGSCPCQPFSVAGLRKGESDERHLWPYFAKLIGECRPAKVFGEQVASADGRLWLSRVRIHLEALDYGVGAADLCAASVGAPHIRQRLYFGAQRLGIADSYGRPAGRSAIEAVGLGNTANAGSRQRASGLANSNSARLARSAHRPEDRREDNGQAAKRDSAWSDSEWLKCADGKTRRVKPGVCLLVDGLPRDVAGALSGFGNAVVPQVAAEFIQAFESACNGLAMTRY